MAQPFVPVSLQVITSIELLCCRFIEKLQCHITHLRQECHNSKFGIFELLVWKETFEDELLTGIVSWRSFQNSPLESSCVVVALIENYSTSNLKNFLLKNHTFWVVTLLSQKSDIFARLQFSTAEHDITVVPFKLTVSLLVKNLLPLYGKRVFFFLCGATAKRGPRQSHSWGCTSQTPTHTHTHTHHRTLLHEWSAFRLDRYLHNTQRQQEVNIHALIGIRTRDASSRVTADIRPRIARPPRLVRKLFNGLKRFFHWTPTALKILCSFVDDQEYHKCRIYTI